MATDQDFVDYIVTQSGLEHRLTYKRMFGEYALYLAGRVVAFACNNQLYLKPTPEGRALIEHVTEGQAYPGSKMYLKIDDELDDRDQLRRLLVKTAEVLPLPPPKKARAAKTKASAAVKVVSRKVAAKKAAAKKTLSPQAASGKAQKGVHPPSAKPADEAEPRARSTTRKTATRREA